MLALLVFTTFAGHARAADEAAAKRREAWRERQEFLRLRGILKLETMVMTGDPSKRVDIVILPDGYSRNTLKAFKTASDGIAKSLVRLQPFENFRNYINFHRLMIESPGGVPVLGSEVDESDLLTCDRSKVEDMVKYAPGCDLMLVISKTKRRARSTAEGNLITICSRTGITATTVHELGHAFGGLADEYVDPDRAKAAGPPPATEPPEVNVTLESEPLLSKWHYWVVPAPRGRKISNPEGAFYRARGVYRPERTCVMRHGGKFCLVCLEQMVRSFFKKIQPIDDQTPKTVNVFLYNNERTEFTVSALEYEAAGRPRVKLDWHWYLNNRPVQPQASKSAFSRYEFDLEKVGPGVHELVVSGDLTDSRVRRDQGMMSDARFWRVEVLSYSRPVVSSPDNLSVEAGDEVTFQVQTKKLDPGNFGLKNEGLPNGSSFDPVTGTFTWTPRDDQAGAHLVDFIVVNDKVEERSHTLIAVKKGAGENRAPKLVDTLDENGFEGQPFDLAFTAEDPDSDALVFDIGGLPEGASFDRRTGELTWTPGYMDARKHYLVVKVTDGFRTASEKIILTVENSPLKADVIADLFADDGDMNFDFCMALRSPRMAFREAALSRLKKTPLAFRAAHAARLLRDGNAFVASKARAIVSAEQTNKEFLACFFRETYNKTWQFTDEPETLKMLREVVDASKQERKWSKMSKRYIMILDKEVKRAERYNALREIQRTKIEEKRQKQREKEEEDDRPF